MKRSLFTFITLSLLVVVLSFTVQQTVHAENQYTPLAPIPGITDNTCPDGLNAAERAAKPECNVSVGKYIPQLVVLAIQIAGALAVLMIVIGGIEYATTNAIQGKEDGKKKIIAAIEGLLLAIGAYVILYTVNPGTLTLNLTIPAKYAKPNTQPTTPISEDPLNPTTPSNPVSGSLSGQPWPSSWPGGAPSPNDASIRSQLFNYRSGIPVTVNARNCSKIGDTGCTSLDGLSNSAINGIKALVNACLYSFTCGNAQPSITITGGTEYWLHNANGTQDPTDPKANTTPHRPGGGGVDLRKGNAAIDALIMKTPGGTGCSTGPHYIFNNTVYVDEQLPGVPPHWHVCYGP